MQILKQESLPKSQIKLSIEVSKDELVKFLDKAYENLKDKVKISGFRPGKAPRYMLEKEIGSERFQKEALDHALPETYYEAIQQAKLLPVGPPEIKLVKFVPTDCLVYEATISVIPEFDLGDYKKIISKSKIKTEDTKVSDEQINEVIKNLQKQRAESKPVLRPVQKSDKVEIDFESFIEGKPIPGGSSKNHPLVIGDGIMVPGFEDMLIGMQKGEGKEFELDFPKDFYKKDLAGQKAKFKVKINDIQEIKLSELDDEFAKQLGHKNLDELRADIKKSLIKEFEEKEGLRFEGELVDKLVESVAIEIPQFLINEELDRMSASFEQQLTKNGLTLDRYLEQIKKTKDDLRKQWQSEAEKRIKIALLLDKVARQEKIEISDKEIKDEIQKIINQNPDKKKEISAELEKEEQKKYIKNVLKNRKVIQYLKNLVVENSPR
jgi:trigger factor